MLLTTSSDNVIIIIIINPQPRKPAETIETLLRLALTDSLCVRYDEGPVADKQEEV